MGHKKGKIMAEHRHNGCTQTWPAKKWKNVVPKENRSVLLSLSLSRCVDRKDAHTKSPSLSSSSLSHNSVVHWCMRWFIVWVRCVKCVLVSALVLNGKLVAREYHSYLWMKDGAMNECAQTKANNEVAHAERACAPTKCMRRTWKMRARWQGVAGGGVDFKIIVMLRRLLFSLVFLNSIESWRAAERINHGITDFICKSK